MRETNDSKLIVSLYDYTGAWAKPYIDAGYPVLLWDYKIEGCILQHFDRLCRKIDEAIEAGYFPYGLLTAPPCTDFSVSGAWTWPDKDKRLAVEPYGPWTQTEYSEALVRIVLHLQDLYGFKFWALENPVGRIDKVVPELKELRRLMFNPCDYGDPYTKKTILWGNFNNDLPLNKVEPIRVCPQGSWLQRLGGKSEKTKALRSATPVGFANAFFNANK